MRSTKSSAFSGGASLHMPRWLHAKLRPCFDKAETKEKFFSRIASIWPATSDEYRLIERAYEAAQRAFKDNVRDDGQSYFASHLRGSALIALVYMRVRDANVIAAILLHDILEDHSDKWTFERLVLEFNREVAELVWWVSKPNGADSAGLSDAEIDRRYHRRLQTAPRKAMFVKLPERLHNMVTIWKQSEGRIRRKVSETHDFIVPLCEKHHILIQEFDDVLRLIEKWLK